MSRYDTVIAGGHVVLPEHGPVDCDVAIKDGRIAALAEDLEPRDADEFIDAHGSVVFPGAVDAHFHLGIYRPVSEDASSETMSCLVGGVTTVLSYFRTGSHYLNRTGTYREILPLVLEATRGRAHTDYSYHLAPMTSAQVDEIDWLIGEGGIASFKYYMFYKSLNLAGDSTDGRAYTMSENYDLGHLFEIMEKVAAADREYGARGRISLSVHCESPELIRVFSQRVLAQDLSPLARHHLARPPLAEALAIHEAGVLANATGARINLLHLSSAEALTAATTVLQTYPKLDVRLETTLHHLGLTYDQLEGSGNAGKVNPPIRTRHDVDALWQGVVAGRIQWVASDHACCPASLKGGDPWQALPGFGGTALLYPLMITEGHFRRQLPLARIAELVSYAPARAFGCFPRKGSISLGADADLAVIDLDEEKTVTPELLHSAQDYTPFHGLRLRGWPVRTILRGRTVYLDGKVVSSASGEFIARPTGSLLPSYA